MTAPCRSVPVAGSIAEASATAGAGAGAEGSVLEGEEADPRGAPRSSARCRISPILALLLLLCGGDQLAHHRVREAGALADLAVRLLPPRALPDHQQVPAAAEPGHLGLGLGQRAGGLGGLGAKPPPGGGPAGVQG